MDFYDQFKLEVRKDHDLVAKSTGFRSIVEGTASIHGYAMFLRETYHLSRHTSRFLAAAATHICDNNEAIRTRFLHHAVEEDGHDKFALKDLKNLGFDPSYALDSRPLPGTLAIVAYHYYLAFIGNPVAMLGAVLVFEGLAEEFATIASEAIQKKMKVSLNAVTFLHTHGKFDIDHMKDARETLNSLIKEDADKEEIIDVAKKMYRFYGLNFEDIYKEMMSN